MVDTTSSEQPADPNAVKVGVWLTPAPDTLGALLSDASTLDAAGADALWLAGEPSGELDVLALAAGLSTVTHRSALVVALTASDLDGSPGRTLDTVSRLSRGRLALLVDAETRAGLGTHPPGLPVFLRVPDAPGVFEGPGDAERWTSAGVPEGRSAWREARSGAAADGMAGVVVPLDPRLVDLLRNPDDPTARNDLRLSQG